MLDNHLPSLAAGAAAPAALSRRHFLWNSGGGLGAIALAWLLNQDKAGAAGRGAAAERKPA